MNFETDIDAAAYYAGTTTAAYEAETHAAVTFFEEYGDTRPDMDPEFRTLVSANDIPVQDWE